MSAKKGVVSISPKLIDPRIKEYGGVADAQLDALIKNAGFSYTSYKFNDGRILVILPGRVAAFIYDNREVLFDALDLGK